MMGFAKGSTHPTRRLRHFGTTGKTPVLKNRSLLSICQAPCVKIFGFSEVANYSRMVAILTRQEGRFANVSNVGQVAVDVGGFLDD
jgi:hypothetical protein